tara:strand:- start:15077 stop:15280 length:204 start_codon:yes stop_codon:yes gene_type:complete
VNKNSVTIKFNNGNLTILCHSCRAIIKTGSDFTKEEVEATKGERHLNPYYCKKCEEYDSFYNQSNSD